MVDVSACHLGLCSLLPDTTGSFHKAPWPSGHSPSCLTLPHWPVPSTALWLLCGGRRGCFYYRRFRNTIGSWLRSSPTTHATIFHIVCLPCIGNGTPSPAVLFELQMESEVTTQLLSLGLLLKQSPTPSQWDATAPLCLRWLATLHPPLSICASRIIWARHFQNLISCDFWKDILCHVFFLGETCNFEWW